MGSLESGMPLRKNSRFERPSFLTSSRSFGSNTGPGGLGQRNRSRNGRTHFVKIGYLQLVCAVVVFFFFIFIFQMFFLPRTVIEDGRKLGRIQDLFKKRKPIIDGDMSFLAGLDFGEDLRLEPVKMLAMFQTEANESHTSRNVVRFGYKKPKLALVFADLGVDTHQILMVTVATALRDIGYEIEVFSQEDGPVQAVWVEVGFPVSVITAEENVKFGIDWLNYNGIIVNSLKAVGALYSLMQEPFSNIPLIWTLNEEALALRLRQYVSSGHMELVGNWKKLFNRATTIVFPNYILPVAYSSSDPGNFLVIPGSPIEPWKDNKFMALHEEEMQLEAYARADDFILVITGSRLLYRGQWLEYAFILQALYPALRDFSSSTSHLKVIILTGNSTEKYRSAVEIIARSLKYPNGTVEHAAADEDEDRVLVNADLVVYGSFLEENMFPDILQKAMRFGKPIICPDLPMIRNHVLDRVNGFLFPKENIWLLTDIVPQLISNGTLSLLARNAASSGKITAKNLMVPECVNGYASLLRNVLTLPSEVAVSKSVDEIAEALKNEWMWHHFEAIPYAHSPNITKRIDDAIEKVEKQFEHKNKQNSVALVATDHTFVYSIWEDQRYSDMVDMKKRREDEEDRTDLPRGTWDEIYRNARRPDRTLHERDEGELERTGQPLCIYEPYYGEGIWHFLHHSSLYRGLRLSTRGRRPQADDIDAASRLPILANAYYRDALGEYGAFFAIANRIDRIHKNAWIGFHSWRATARNASLSSVAERSLLDAIEAQSHGDTLYFWVGLDSDPRSQSKQDFWSFCDAINAGNCQFAFREALRKMYGIRHNMSSLPSMPSDGGTWSVMHCWALPTRSFLEFIMFSRMFVDALDAEFYDEHHRTGHCYLSLAKDKHCYSRLLELLINVWAYHSARRIVYMNPQTGSMQEQHGLNSRKGRMWIKWFQFATLKSMDEDLAEEFDSDQPIKRWLWPSTGEIMWQGVYEKERTQRMMEKEKKRKKSRDKIERMKRKSSRQKVIGKYVKPVEEEANNSTQVEETVNTTDLEERRLRRFAV